MEVTSMYRAVFMIIITIVFLLSPNETVYASWHIDIEVSTQDPASDTGIASNTLTIGADKAATGDYDNTLDTIAMLDGPIQAYFSHQEYPSDRQKLWRDFRDESLPQEWELNISADGERKIDMKWNLAVPDNLGLLLIDPNTNKEINMRTSGSYSYVTTIDTSRKFILKVTSSEDNTTSSPQPSHSGGTRGGGCGYIRTNNNDQNPPWPTIVMNMLILLSPLLWGTLARRPRPV